MTRGLPLALDTFVGVAPGVIYHLAPPHIVHRGFGYLRHEKVLFLDWDDEEGGVVAEVEGSGLYTVFFGVRDGGVLSECECPAFQGSGSCKHVIAVAALVFSIVNEKISWRKLLSPDYLEEMSELLFQSAGGEYDGEEDGADPASDAEICLVLNPRSGDWMLESRGRVLRRQVARLGFYSPHGDERFIHRLDSWLMLEELTRIVKQLRNAGIPLRHYMEDGTCVELTGGRVNAESIVLLDVSSGDGRVAASPRPVGKGGVEVDMAAKLNHREILGKDGRIYAFGGSAADVFQDLASPYSVEWAGGSLYMDDEERRDDVSAEEFNMRSLSAVFVDVPMDEGNLRLYADGKPAKEPSQCPRCRSQIKVKVTRPGASSLRFQTVQEVDGIDISLKNAAWVVREGLLHAGGRKRMLNAKGRVEALVSAALALPLMANRKARKELVAETVQREIFRRQRLTRLAREWLEPFRLLRLDTGEPRISCPDSLVCFPGTEEPWRVAANPVPLLAYLWLGLRHPSRSGEIQVIGDDMTMHAESASDLLKRVGLVCQAVGARMEFNDRAVETRPVSIRIEVGEGSGIDWFELRPEIRCGSLVIGQGEWEKLIRGELLLEDDGKLVLPQLEHQEAVRQLLELTGSKGGRKGKSRRDGFTGRVPRLQVLDWLDYRRMGVEVSLPPEAEALFESLRNFTGIDKQDIPKTLKATLREYQRHGFDWLVFLYRHRFGACLADDMGLGKTLQAIALLAWRKSQASGDALHPHLVVVPPTLVFNWASEIGRFCPSLNVAEYTGSARDLDAAMRADVVLTTYDIVRLDIGKLSGRRFDIAVFDETQTLKNLQAARTRAATRLRRRFTLCLTGTPMENHVGEYFSIMNLALPGLFGDYGVFRRKLREGDGGLLLQRSRPFILRRTKETILKELPPKVENDLYLDMTEEQKEIYTRTVGEVREEVMEAYEDKPKAQAGIVALAALTRLRQVCISPELLGRPMKRPAPKVEYLVDQLTELIDEGHSVLVFSQFTRTLDLLGDQLKDTGLRTLRLDGKTPAAKRKKQVQTFQEDPAAHVFLISLKAGGVGLNLTRATYIYHADPWWNPAVERQAADRAHRIGQSKTVFIQRLVMRHTVEEKMMTLKARKQALFDAIVEAPTDRRGTGTAITREDMEFLLDG